MKNRFLTVVLLLAAATLQGAVHHPATGYTGDTGNTGPTGTGRAQIPNFLQGFERRTDLQPQVQSVAGVQKDVHAVEAVHAVPAVRK